MALFKLENVEFSSSNKKLINGIDDDIKTGILDEKEAFVISNESK